LISIATILCFLSEPLRHLVLKILFPFFLSLLCRFLIDENKMVNDNENQSPDDVAEALQRSEALRAANESAPNNNNGNFTIRINVGGNVSVSNEQQGTSTIRQRRTGADSTSLQQESSSNNANSNNPAPVHARTIDRFPGQNNQGGSIRRVHIQNANGGQPIRVVTGQRVNHRRVQLQRAHHGQAVRVSPGNGNAQVRIVRSTGQPQMQQQQQQQVARVQLPPLVPQPLPYHGSHASSGNESSSDQHHEDRNEFKCLICFGMCVMCALLCPLLLCDCLSSHSVHSTSSCICITQNSFRIQLRVASVRLAFAILVFFVWRQREPVMLLPNVLHAVVNFK
jgi:hypothetical protein